MDNPRHFVLVHGACHGAWCWYKVVALLQSSGHKVTALDMAASGIHPKQVHELDSITDYYEPLIEFVRSLPQDERVILVGHSSGGIGISMAMELFPKKIAVAVFVASIVPSPDLGFVTINKEDLSLATLLQRPTRTFGDQELLQKKTNVTNENYGIVAKVCIVCQQDKLLKYDFQLSMAERNSKNDVKVIPDADHMPMFSKPQELFAYLQEIAEIYY
ncbi:methyl jasmonate esterase 1-like isoform X2 [Vicia villosa]|uniref:methyl jasmonate esterase 1-like isoform X2 n=1 Tax=Vicia villosa TaxID=3911 RepID=UPI00273AE6D4|nr:methyl jasmonate esterase 1-like isoform X2 [Vicia villosa]